MSNRVRRASRVKTADEVVEVGRAEMKLKEMEMGVVSSIGSPRR